MTAVALALCAALLLGTALVFTQFGLRHIPPLRGACVSIPATTLLFVALAPLTVDFAHWEPRSALVFAGVGIVFPAGATLLTFQANRLIGPTVTGALGNLAPVFAVTLAILTLGEWPGPVQLAGLAVVLSGVAILFGPLGGAGWRWALVLPLLAAFVRGLAQPMVKGGLEAWPNPFAATLIGYLVSTAVVLSVGIAAYGWRVWLPSAPGTAWFTLTGLCNGFSALLMYTALARSPVAVVAPLIATYPLFTLALSALLRPGSADLSRRVVSGVMLIVAGVGLLLLGLS